jgi:hypothetical protein
MYFKLQKLSRHIYQFDQMIVMCRLYRITDLGILHFYFSSKNCSSKVYTNLKKVVDLVTLSTAKLSLLFLDFSMIL